MTLECVLDRQYVRTVKRGSKFPFIPVSIGAVNGDKYRNIRGWGICVCIFSL
jgi:hypothetical protein